MPTRTRGRRARDNFAIIGSRNAIIKLIFFFISVVVSLNLAHNAQHDN
jgi:hypothetical protein